MHLQYTNYGDREIKLRLPNGLLFPKSVWKHYIDGERLKWKKDKRGEGGILTLAPYLENGDRDDLWGFDEFIEPAIKIREQLVLGDLRALYALWMCASSDDYLDPADVDEPPVPHGLSKFPARSLELFNFFEADPLILIAASEAVGAAEKDAVTDSPDKSSESWIQSLDWEQARSWLQKFATGDAVAVKAKLLTEARHSQTTESCPTTKTQRTLADLQDRTAELREIENAKRAKKRASAAKRAEAKAEKQRQARMVEMAADPKKWLTKTEQLVKSRGTDNYQSAAEILADLREALSDQQGETIVRKHAAHLVKKHPTLTRLKSSLRKQNLLD